MSSPEEYDYVFKVLMIGDSGVGKSALLMRFCQGSFDPSKLQNTIGVDFNTKILTTADSKRVKLQLWDSAGSERFRTLTPSYYRGAHGVLLVYDITKLQSFQSVEQYWLPEVRRHAADSSKLPTLLIGNKSDLASTERAVEEKTAKAFASPQQQDLPFVETSAKMAVNVDYVLELMTAEMRRIFHSSSSAAIQQEKDTDTVGVDRGRCAMKQDARRTGKCCF